MLLKRGLLDSTFHHTEESPFASADGNGNTDRKGWKDHYSITLNQQWLHSSTWRAYASPTLDEDLREATWPQLIGGTQQKYSVMEPENDMAVEQKTHCVTQSTTNGLGFIRSDPTTLEMSIEAAKQTQMHVDPTKFHWGLKSVAAYDVFRKHSGSEDKAPWQEFTCQQVYLLDCRPDTQQTDSKFRDAPWRKKDTPKIANKTQRRPPTPPPPPRKRTAVFSEPTEGCRALKHDDHNPQKIPTAATPFRCSQENRPDAIMTTHAVHHHDGGNGMSLSSYAPICSKTQIKRYPKPPPPPDRSKGNQLSPCIVPLPQQKRCASMKPNWALHNEDNSGMKTAAHQYYRETAKRKEMWTGARTKTQQRRDRKKEMRIKKYRRLNNLRWDAPTTGAGKLRREQKKKAKLRIKMDMMREFMRAGLFEHRSREANTTRDTDQEKKQLVQLNLQSSI